MDRETMNITVIPSKRFLRILQDLKNVLGIPDSLKEKLSAIDDGCNTVNLTTPEIRWSHETMLEKGLKPQLHVLLLESEIVLPKNRPPPPRNPELEARVRKLIFEQENREYKSMTKSVDATYQHQTAGLGEIGRDLRTVNRQLVSGAQYLLSVVGTFFAIFIALGMATSDYGIRALIATIAALIVGLAEMFFIIRDDLRQEDQMAGQN